jgi:glycosyltransferase involved in cell wall biosynthesis
VFCGEEDFGIAPVEANAHGAPVVGYARGGLLETMQPGRTAVLFDEQTVDGVVDAVERCLASPWDADALRENAARFAPERYREGMRQVLARAMNGHSPSVA